MKYTHLILVVTAAFFQSSLALGADWGEDLDYRQFMTNDAGANKINSDDQVTSCRVHRGNAFLTCKSPRSANRCRLQGFGDAELANRKIQIRVGTPAVWKNCEEIEAMTGMPTAGCKIQINACPFLAKAKSYKQTNVKNYLGTTVAVHLDVWQNGLVDAVDPEALDNIIPGTTVRMDNTKNSKLRILNYTNYWQNTFQAVSSNAPPFNGSPNYANFPAAVKLKISKTNFIEVNPTCRKIKSKPDPTAATDIDSAEATIDSFENITAADGVSAQECCESDGKDLADGSVLEDRQAYWTRFCSIERTRYSYKLTGTGVNKAWTYKAGSSKIIAGIPAKKMVGKKGHKTNQAVVSSYIAP